MLPQFSFLRNYPFQIDKHVVDEKVSLLTPVTTVIGKNGTGKNSLRDTYSYSLDSGNSLLPQLPGLGPIFKTNSPPLMISLWRMVEYG